MLEPIEEKLFNKIKSKSGQTYEDEGDLHLVLSEICDLKSIDGVRVFFPEDADDLLHDWSKFYYWLDGFGLDEESVIGEDYDVDNKLPVDYIKDMDNLKLIVVNHLLASEESEYLYGVYYCKLEFDGDHVFVIFGNGSSMDGWALGYGHEVDVVDDINEYSSDPKNGIYLRENN